MRKPLDLAHLPLRRRYIQGRPDFHTASVFPSAFRIKTSPIRHNDSKPNSNLGNAGALFFIPDNEYRAAVFQDSRAVNGRFGNGGEGKMMMRYVCEIGEFVRRLRIQARFGELSRAPLQLLRLELRKSMAECDWVARPPDRWDVELQLKAAERNASLQALKDAIDVRDLLFHVVPDLYSAVFRVYRQSPDEKLKLIITGTVSLGQHAPVHVRSLAMRAKLFGLRFWLNEGVLESLPPEEYAVNS